MWRPLPRGLPATGAFLAPTAGRLAAEDDFVFAATAVEPSAVTAEPPGPVGGTGCRRHPVVFVST